MCCNLLSFSLSNKNISFNNLLTRDVLICLLLPEWYWPECFNIHLHNQSLATGVSFCKSPLVNNVLTWPNPSFDSCPLLYWSLFFFFFPWVFLTLLYSTRINLPICSSQNSQSSLISLFYLITFSHEINQLLSSSLDYTNLPKSFLIFSIYHITHYNDLQISILSCQLPFWPILKLLSPSLTLV